MSSVTHDDILPAEDLNEQMRFRLQKRAALLDAGTEAYPVKPERTHSLGEVRVREQFGDLPTGESSGRQVAVVGRVVFLRNSGKLCFATLQEGDGTRLQVMLSLAEIGPDRLADWKALVDLGDHVQVHGEVISSRRGELSVMADSWAMASKALRPLPTLHAGVNEETRVRQRYVDLMVREEARQMVRTRAAITRTLRETLNRHDYIEVETPILQLVHGGATARPFETHLNAFDQKMTLRIALELYLKRAVVGGIDRVYEIGRIFRNEGVDSTHSPEFTMLECYEAYADQFVMADRMKEMILACADLLGSRTIETAKGTIDLDGEWAWLGVYPGLSPPRWARRSRRTPASRSCGRSRNATRSRWIRPGARRRWCSSSSPRSWSRRSSSRPSSTTTHRRRSRSPGPTARTRG
ncbi:hypothetical protein MN0502_00980 [Arthrobacter sp. MN05-02]|nr:hypothetical protein MN0502_00980 [Arthrobacter sp. MN05-02]